MKLHQKKEEFKDLIEATSQYFNIPGVYIEKDYWVTLVLKRLANSSYKDSIVFKGGTSLSKGYGVIFNDDHFKYGDL